MASYNFKQQISKHQQTRTSISQFSQFKFHDIPSALTNPIGLASTQYSNQSLQKLRIPFDIGFGRNGKYGLDVIIRLISWGQNFQDVSQIKGYNSGLKIGQQNCKNLSFRRILQKVFTLAFSSTLGLNLKFVPLIASTISVVFGLFPINLLNQFEVVELVLAQILQDGGNFVWGLIHPQSQYLATCLQTLISIKKEHNSIYNQAQSGGLKRGHQLEQKWRSSHQKSARKVKNLMRDLHDSGKPPLKAFFSLLKSVSCSSVESGKSNVISLYSDWSLSVGLSQAATENKSSQRIEFQGIQWNESKLEFVMVQKFFDQQNISEVQCEKISTRCSSCHSIKRDQSFNQQLKHNEYCLLKNTNEVQLFQDQSNEFRNLNLFGRGDRAQNQIRPSLSKSSFLVVRGIYLFFVFVPFLLVIVLSFVSKVISKKGTSIVQRQYQYRHTRQQNVSLNQNGDDQYMSWKFLLWGCRWSGAAFIKWGQWACTREDLFPKSFCSILSELHDKAPKHSFQHTRKQVEAAFHGKSLEQVFVSFEEQPVASGSIAQVHRAQISIDGQIQEVAVKVCHPGVCDQITEDFLILKALAGVTKKFKGLRSLNLQESISNFSSTMTAQTDLRVEAVHILNFERNFKNLYPSIRFPKVLFSSQSVLIESFEAGASVAGYIQTPKPVNTQIVSLGVDSYLKMLLLDNLVHTDLHPGNILVDEKGCVENGGANIVLLDCGLAEELSEEVRFNFISFLNMIVKGDGVRAAELILSWGSNQQDANVAEFGKDVCQFFDVECNILSDNGIDLDGVMKGVLKIVRRHGVSVDSKYAALVIGVCVLVGFATSLDKNLNLMDAAAPCLLYYNLTGKIMGRLYG